MAFYSDKAKTGKRRQKTEYDIGPGHRENYCLYVTGTCEEEQEIVGQMQQRYIPVTNAMFVLCRVLAACSLFIQ